MIVYVPVYDNGRKVAAINSAKARYFKTPGYNGTILYYGICYNGEHIFTTEAAAWAWWNKEYNIANQFRITWEEVLGHCC